MIDQTEAEVRLHLAALYRLVALQGWDDLIFTHLSARIPGSRHQFLINRFGLTFDEVCASNLVRVDEFGEVVDGSGALVNPAGFTVHSAVHMARLDAAFVIHLHTDDGVAVSAQADGVLPLSQTAMSLWGAIGYHDYEGIAFDLDERERLARDLSDKRALILRNHGTLSVGPDAASAWLVAYFLERACTIQVRALAGRVALVHPPESVAEKTGLTAGSAFDGSSGPFVMPTLLRRLDRIDSSYRN